MAFCDKCGAQVADGAAFCAGCGAARGAGSGGGAKASGGTEGIQENVAGLLAYAFAWITGIIFLVIDKRPFVRFHAAQSIVLFGALSVLSFVLAFVFTGMGFIGGMVFMLIRCIQLLSLVLWVLCMVKAYQGERFKLPLVGDIAESIAK